MIMIANQAQPRQRHASDRFRELVEATRADLFRLLLNFTRNHHDAEDLLQETYLNAFNNLGEFRGDAEPTTWLYRIALNKAIDQRRRFMRAPFAEPDDETFDPIAADDPHATLERRSLQQRVHAALNRLTPIERAIFVLRNDQGCSVTETAEVLGTAEGTIKSLHFRALQKLRDVLVPVVTQEGLR